MIIVLERDYIIFEAVYAACKIFITRCLSTSTLGCGRIRWHVRNATLIFCDDAVVWSL
jgi:hypothetical protein